MSKEKDKDLQDRAFVKPPKNLAKMTDEEIYSYAEVLWEALAGKLDPTGELREVTDTSEIE